MQKQQQTEFKTLVKQVESIIRHNQKLASNRKVETVTDNILKLYQCLETLDSYEMRYAGPDRYSKQLRPLIQQSIETIKASPALSCI